MSSETALQTVTKSPEVQLQECLTSIHESSRVASEINALEVKLNSLSSIRSTLVTGDNLSNTTLDQLNKTIGEVEGSLKTKRLEMIESEKLVIEGFMTVMTNIAEQSEEKTEKVVAGMKDSLSRFGQLLRKEFKEMLTVNETRITQLENGKMNIADKEAFIEQLNTFKSDIVAVQKSTMTTIMGKNTDVMKFLTKKVEDFCQQVDPDHVSVNVYNKVMESVEPKLKEQLELVQNHNKESKESVSALQSTIDQIVKKELDQQITPTNIQKIIQSLPEYELMQKAGKQLAPTITPAAAPIDIAEHPSLLAIKQSVQSLTNQITELKQSNESTRTLVDALRQHNALPSTSTPSNNNVDFHAAVKHMEKMEKEVTLIYNNIKMIETVVSLKSSEMESNDGSRKRPRVEEGDMVAFNKNTEDYLARLTEIETKHQKLLDFIVQCKDTVLDEQFPVKIEAAMSKIEQILMNHEKFIAFLVDPFSTTKAVSIPTDNTALSKDMLSPSMVDAISQLVKKTAEEISLPLQKKIKLLEEKLEARSS